MPPREPLPTEAIRDLLGIVRAMYAAGVESGAGDHSLEELRQVGIELVQALDLAKAAPGSMGHVAAWRHAEQATARLGRLVQVTAGLEPVVRAAARRALRVAAAPLRVKPSGRH